MSLTLFLVLALSLIWLCLFLWAILTGSNGPIYFFGLVLGVSWAIFWPDGLICVLLLCVLCAILWPEYTRTNIAASIEIVMFLVYACVFVVLPIVALCAAVYFWLWPTIWSWLA